MRNSKLEKLRNARRKEAKQTTVSSWDELLAIMLGGPLNPTQRETIYDTHRITGYMGPEGVAKTSTGCAKGLLRALTQPGSQGIVARKDFNDLLKTTMQTMQDMLNRLPPGILIDRDKQPPVRWWIQPMVEGPPSEIVFTGLKEELSGHAYDWAYVDEADEVEEQPILRLDGRMRSQASLKNNAYSLLLTFNPPPKTHWLYTACTGYDAEGRYIRDPWVHLYRPKPQENNHNLPIDYFERRLASYSEDMKQRLVYGEWGSVFDGEAVYREFSRKLHVRRLTYNPNYRLFRFWDFGYNRPCCIFAQMDAEGRLLVLRCILGNKEEIGPFAARCKSITAQYYGESINNVTDYGDPAVAQHKDTGSTQMELTKANITMLYTYQTRDMDMSLRAVRTQLERMIRGEPALQFDEEHAAILIDALAGGYRKDKQGLKPLKDGYYEHPADAFRYGVFNVFGGMSQIPVVPGSTRYPDSLAYDARQDQDLVQRGLVGDNLFLQNLFGKN